MGYRQRVRFAQAVAAVGTVVVPGAQPRAIVQKGTLCLIRLIVLGALRRTAFNGKDGVESLGRKERHIAHIARGLRVLGITILIGLHQGMTGLIACKSALRRSAFNGKPGTESLGQRHIAYIARGMAAAYLRVLGDCDCVEFVDHVT